MAISVSQLKIVLSASSQPLTKGLQKGETQVRSFGRRVRRDLRAPSSIGLAKFTAGLAAAATAAAGVLVIMRQISAQQERLNDLAGQAQQIGIDPGRLQAIQDAAQDFANIDGKQAFNAVRRFERRLGEAIVGTGELAKTLDRVNLSAEQLSKQAPAERLMTFLKSVQRLSSRPEQLTAINKAFDIEGTALINLVDNLPQVIERLQNAPKLNLGGIAEAQVASNRAQRARRDLFGTLADVTADARKRFGDDISGITESINRDLQSAIQWWRGIVGASTEAAAATDQVADSTERAMAAAQAQAEAQARAAEAATAEQARLIGLRDSLRGQADPEGTRRSRVANQIRELQRAGLITTQEAAELWEKIGKKSGEVRNNIDPIADRAKQIAQGLQSPLEKFNAEVAELNDLFDVFGAISQTELDRGLAQAQQRFLAATGGAQQNRTTFTGLAPTATRNSQEGFEAVMRRVNANTTQQGLDHLAGLTQQELDEIRAMRQQIAAMNRRLNISPARIP